MCCLTALSQSNLTWGEPLLTRALQRPVVTINSGVGSYTTSQEYAFLKAHGDAIAPDVVMLLFVENDIEPNVAPFDPWSEHSLAGKTPPQVVSSLLQRSWLYRLLSFVRQYSTTGPPPAAVDRDDPGVAQALSALRGIAEWCRDRHLVFLTFYYRGDYPAPGGLFEAVAQAGRESGFHVGDVGNWWGGADLRSLTNSVIDSHPNAAGHQVLARGMADAFLGSSDRSVTSVKAWH